MSNDIANEKMPNYVGFPDIYDNHSMTSSSHHVDEPPFENENEEINDHVENFDINTYNNMVSTRNNLDFKLREINEMKDSIYSENKLRNDANLYTTFMLTVLATTMVAYIFIKST